MFAGVDYDGFALDDDFGEREAARLREAAAAGARGLKVWKRLASGRVTGEAGSSPSTIRGWTRSGRPPGSSACRS